MTTAECELVVEGMHCTSCGLLVDETLEDLDGVIRCATNVRRGRAHIEFEPTLVTLDEIAAAISELGYQTTPEARDSG